MAEKKEKPESAVLLEPDPIPSSPGELLGVLSKDTVGESYGIVTLKLTHGQSVRHVRLRIKPIDVIDISRKIDEMSADVKKRILSKTSGIRSVGFSDDAWLQSLAAFVYGLDAPHVIEDDKGVAVWVARGKPQNLNAAMIAIATMGFDYWHVNEVSNAVTALTRNVNDDDFAGNF